MPLRQSSTSLLQRLVKVLHRYTQVRGRLGSLGQRRNLDRWTTAASPAFVRAVIKRSLDWGGVDVSVLQAVTELLYINVSGVEAAIHCDDEFWFCVGMEVSEWEQN